MIYEYFAAYIGILALFFQLVAIGIFIVIFLIETQIITIIAIIIFLAQCLILPIKLIFKINGKVTPYKMVIPMALGIIISTLLIVLNTVNIAIEGPIYERKSYDIEYILQDGVQHTAASGVDEYDFNRGLNEADLKEARKTGYKFEGWYYDPECTIPFESFGAYEKCETIILYPKMTCAEIKVCFNFYAFDNNGMTRYIDYEMSDIMINFGDKYTLPSTVNVEGFRFVGWTTEKYDIKNKYISNSLSYVKSFTLSEDLMSIGSVTVTGIFVKEPVGYVELNKVFIADNYEYTKYNTPVGCSYMVKGSEKTKYTLVINSGTSYGGNDKNDYFVAIITDANGKFIAELSSKDCGGSFVVPANEDFLINFKSYNSNGTTCADSSHTAAYVILTDNDVDCYSLAGAVNNKTEIETNINKNGRYYLSKSSKIDSRWLTDSSGEKFEMYHLANYTYTHDGKLNEFGFYVNEQFKVESKAVGCISVYKDGVFINSVSVDLTTVNIYTYVKVLDLSEFADGNYVVKISLTTRYPESFTTYFNSIYFDVR